MKDYSERKDDRGPICIFLPDLHPGGTQKVQLLLAKGLIELGEQVDFVVSRKVGKLVSHVPDAARLIDLHGWASWTPIGAFVNYLCQSKPRVVFSALNQANLVSLLAVKIAKVETKVVMSVHNHFGVKWKYEFTPSAPLRKLLFRWMYSSADRVIVVSDGLRNYLLNALRLDADKVLRIYNPVDAGAIRSKCTLDCGHPWLTSTRTVPVIITVGRLVAQKDHETLVRAFQKISEKRDCRLIIIGDGKNRHALKSLVKRLKIGESVDLVGYQENPYAWMKSADIFVLTSKWEGFGMVLVEALVLGKVVLASNCESGPSEILKENCLFEPGDESELADILLSAMRFPEKYLQKPSEKFMSPILTASSYTKNI